MPRLRPANQGAAMSAEVAGQAEGVTLLEAIEGGDVPYPERMSYVAWLKWRRETGSRPLSKRDGVSTTPEQEAALWRKVMKFLHDAEGEDEEEEEEEEDSELVPEASGAGGDSPPRVDVSAAARELAMVPTGAAYVPATAPGSRPAGPSGPPSTAGSVPGTAEGLQAELRAIFRPDQEPVADYLTRVSRIVLALGARGVTVSSRDLDALSTKATLLVRPGRFRRGHCCRAPTPPKHKLDPSFPVRVGPAAAECSASAADPLFPGSRAPQSVDARPQREHQRLVGPGGCSVGADCLAVAPRGCACCRGLHARGCNGFGRRCRGNRPWGQADRVGRRNSHHSGSSDLVRCCSVVRESCRCQSHCAYATWQHRGPRGAAVSAPWLRSDV